jgi:hypothetical protein
MEHGAWSTGACWSAQLRTGQNAWAVMYGNCRSLPWRLVGVGVPSLVACWALSALEEEAYAAEPAAIARLLGGGS